MGAELDAGFTTQSDLDWPSVFEMSVPEKFVPEKFVPGRFKGLSCGLFNGVLPSIGVRLRTAHSAFGSLYR